MFSSNSAKLYGSFAAIDGGQTEEALAVLTGLPCQTVNDIHKPERITSEKLFQVLVGWHKLGYLCCASCGHTNRDPNEYKRFGLQHAHAYTILGVAAVGRDSSRLLVKLRNPWGSGEWKGRWADGASQWTPAAKRICDNVRSSRTDGIFWMCVDDLRQFFNRYVRLSRL